MLLRWLRLTLSTLFVLALSTGASYADAEGITLPQFSSSDNQILGIVLVVSVFAVLYGFFIRAQVMKLSPGTAAMQKVGAAIRAGAYAYLQKQVKTMLPLVLVLAVLLFLLFHSQPGYTTTTAIGVSIAFLVGVTLSYIAGYVGMGMAVHGNQRTAHQALSTYKGALETAFRSGAVAGMMTVGLGLLGATVFILIFKSDAMKVLVGFGFGGSLAALFMRVGGGIFTKAADVGADLVGKVEQDIPEDDPRNAATIADNVGDNVGDCAGMAADVFESYLVTLVAALILGAVVGGPQYAMALVIFPLVIHGIGIVASVIGIASFRGSEDISTDPMRPITKGLWVTAILAIIGFTVTAHLLPGIKNGINVDGHHISANLISLATALGVVLALAIGALTEYFTGPDRRPVTEIANNAQTGPATLILSGFSFGLESATWGVLVVAAVIFGIVTLFTGSPGFAAYAIALSGLGLLTTTGYILAMDTFGPISDNANGIVEMSGVLGEGGPAHDDKNMLGEKVIAKLDSAGNTTKALTKGFAIATAVIAAVALFRSFMAGANLGALAFSLADPKVFVGLLIGGAAPFLFCSFAIQAVSRAAFELVTEVRRQFREIPGIMSGEGTPDYARCVDIVTAAAQRELLGPGILAICLPILVGFALGAPALGGYLAGAIVTGQLMAVFLSNTGGAWDNAKKKIEDGMFGGKGTPEHKAAVIGDTVGDPFKDTAGPALNPLIKVMNLVGVLIAGVVTMPHMPIAMRVGVCVVTAGLLIGAITFSKRGADTSPGGTPTGSGAKRENSLTH
ncbi:MAG: sodium-translocating pyrophosphatase [Capsulimonadaceae bacterium]